MRRSRRTLVRLPLVAGPIFSIVNLTPGARFAAHATSGFLLGLVPVALSAVALLAVVFAAVTIKLRNTSASMPQLMAAIAD